MLAVVGLAALAMPVELLIVSLVHLVLVQHYLVWSTGPYYVLAGIGLATLRPALFAIVSVALVAAPLLGRCARRTSVPLEPQVRRSE